MEIDRAYILRWREVGRISERCHTSEEVDKNFQPEISLNITSAITRPPLPLPARNIRAFDFGLRLPFSPRQSSCRALLFGLTIRNSPPVFSAAE